MTSSSLRHVCSSVFCLVVWAIPAWAAHARAEAPAPGETSSDPSAVPRDAPAPSSSSSPAAGSDGTAGENSAATAPSVEDAGASAGDESQVTSEVASFAATRLKNSPAVVTVLTGEDIRASGARDLVDVLNLVPGYFLGVDTEGVVGAGFRGLWGYEGKILLMIDNKEMNELLFSTTQLGNEFPIELIERVEVVRGPGSVIYGGNAELSVINVVTRSLQGSTDALITGTYGQMTGASDPSTGFARRKLTVSGRYIVDQVPGLSTFASVSLGQGQRSVRRFVDNNNVSSPMEGQSALDPSVVQLGVGYKDLQATFLYHRLAMTTIDGLGQALPAPVSMAFSSYHLEVLGAFRPSDRFELVPRINVTSQMPWQLTNDPDLLYDKSVRRVRGRLLGRWAALDQLQITVGGDAILDEAWLLSPPGVINTPFGTSDQVSYRTLGTFLEMYSENPFVNVAAGARYDHHSFLGGALVPRVALQRTISRLSVKAIYSQSFRAPGIENINANPAIRPERTRIFELESIVELTPRQRVAANVYDIALNAPIAFFTDPMTMADSYVNLGRQGTRGVEVSYRLRGAGLNLDANYSFYTVSLADNTPTYTVPGRSNVFLAAPAHRASIRATFRPTNWIAFSPSLIGYGPRFMRGPDLPDESRTAMEIPAQVLANLFVYSDRLGIPGVTLGVGFYNIFGTDYNFVHVAAAPGAYVDDHPSLPGLDREVMVRLSYLFER